MFRNLVVFTFVLFLLSGCAIKEPQKSKSAIVIFQTPVMKFYDKGFINKFEDHINLQVFEAGHLALNLFIYQDKICQSTFECISGEEFNKSIFTIHIKKIFYTIFFCKIKFIIKIEKMEFLLK